MNWLRSALGCQAPSHHPVLLQWAALFKETLRVSAGLVRSGIDAETFTDLHVAQPTQLLQEIESSTAMPTKPCLLLPVVLPTQVCVFGLVTPDTSNDDAWPIKIKAGDACSWLCMTVP